MIEVLFSVKATFCNDRAQLYLIFQPLCYTLRSSSDKNVSWKSKGLSTEKILTPDSSLSLRQLGGMKIQIFIYYLKEAV